MMNDKTTLVALAVIGFLFYKRNANSPVVASPAADAFNSLVTSNAPTTFAADPAAQSPTTPCCDQCASNPCGAAATSSVDTVPLRVAPLNTTTVATIDTASVVPLTVAPIPASAPAPDPVDTTWTATRVVPSPDPATWTQPFVFWTAGAMHDAYYVYDAMGNIIGRYTGPGQSGPWWGHG